MAHQQFAGVAVLVVLTFMVLALTACANSAQTTVAAYGPAVIAPIPAEASGQPEFHGAPIGADTLRSRLLAE
ncbi:hypothetical protein [Terricaulis sp.]|uniref:hypothetical protein n=1 Tax=Terricaulis sp. TaxID=2768686 RepID=UPI002AC5EA58|nr:hypothetical protein [Terricaulis sp.]MDZ4693056.1 hypothetical protein [Terricaulis sp.]